MGYSIDILNNIRLNQNTEYQSRIPEATQANLSMVGQAFATYDVEFNTFHSALIQKIGKTKLDQMMYENTLSRFKTGGVTSPHDIEEIFIHMAKSEGAYDPDGKNPLGRRSGPDVDVIYHREGRRDYYAISIGDIDFVKVFRSEATLDAFILGKINAVYSADEKDEFLCMKNLLATYKNKEKTACGYFDYEVPDLESETTKEEWARTFVKTLRKSVLDLTVDSSTLYNVMGVERKSKADKLVLFVHKDVLVEADVELLAKAFHQSNTDMKVVPTIIPMADFGDLEDTYALMVEDGWFEVRDTLLKMEPQRNAQGLFTNYFYHHHQIMSASTFKNAVRFKKASA